MNLDQLRIFVAAVDEGSFSAAGRKLGRTQSVISQTIANLEWQLHVRLFDRTGRRPSLAPDGVNLLPAARTIVRGVDSLKAQARSLSEGLEAELSIVVDVLFPQERITAALRDFVESFPNTPLRLHVEALGAVADMVLDRRCSMGIMGTLPTVHPSLQRQRLLTVPLVTVVSPAFPLANKGRPITLDELQHAVQLVLTDRSKLTLGQDFGVQSLNVWRLGDLGAKHAFLRAGLGWGHMPRDLVAEDLRRGTLVEITVEGPPPGTMPMHAVYRTDSLPGPAAQWLIEKLREPHEGISE